MSKIISGNKVTLKEEKELLQILRNRNFNGNDENRIKIAKEWGGKEVTIDNPQPHHNYFFTKEASSFPYDAIQ